MSQDDAPGASDCDGPPVSDGPADTSALAGEPDPDLAVHGEARDRPGDRPARPVEGR
ncbi:hypothetical protein [Salinigranum salinum]|uniref:hypothetical protein n=1 Tax=Salinigranum salinum TaxID=1364937 RepID=UPI0018649DAA|nr:hypothetical protein [Salinigranum salinum]